MYADLLHYETLLASAQGLKFCLGKFESQRCTFLIPDTLFAFHYVCGGIIDNYSSTESRNVNYQCV